MSRESTAIAAIAYEAEHGKLFVRFVSGDQYVYVGVPERVHLGFVRAASKGRFFHRIIRDRYPYNRVA